MVTILSFHHHDEVLRGITTAEPVFVPRKSDILIFSGRRMEVLEVQVEYVIDSIFIRVYLA
jgi:hypothetical protein